MAGQLNKGIETVTITSKSAIMEGLESLRMDDAPKIDATVPDGHVPPIQVGQTVDRKGCGMFATRDI